MTPLPPRAASTRLRLVALSAAAVVMLVGCGSSKSGAPASSASASSSTVSFHGVTVAGAQNLTAKPRVSSTSTAVAPALQVQDLVVGAGAAATPTSTVSVQYVGVLYANGKQFDASWDSGSAASFPLTGVVPGFTQGIGGQGTGGTTGVAPMKVGGRRLMILPAALGYGASGTPDGSIGPGASIVFVVDLLAVQ